MEGQDPAALMTASFSAIAAKDVDALSATHHEDVVENFIVLGPVEGIANTRAFFAELFAAAPDLEFTIERVMGIDEKTAVGQWRMKGTLNGGPFQGIEPTGRVLDIRGIDVMEFEDGLLKYNTIYYDGLSNQPEENRWELYDLRSDPHETRNVYGDGEYRETAAELKVRLRELQVQVKDRP
jgi:steroid delta-isomerase-like uncharacterized protein